ncbi:GspMb/PilO family protein [Neotabrizicola sp. sgz301269]|uniref:GspMb/PilO family protein n=1 Tax=Neotabrizicola sp. sgz301269 TaxID=3276282 RepID=UPI00376F90BE
MMGLLRLFPGLVVAALFAFGVVRCATEPGRARLEAARTEALNLAQQEEQLARRIKGLKATDASIRMPIGYVWPGRDRAEIELALQKVLVEISTEAGMQLVTFGSGPSSAVETAPTVAYDVELQGGHVELARFLALLEAHRPAVAISYLWLRPLPVDPKKPMAPLNARLTVWAFWGGGEAQP